MSSEEALKPIREVAAKIHAELQEQTGPMDAEDPRRWVGLARRVLVLALSLREEPLTKPESQVHAEM